MKKNNVVKPKKVIAVVEASSTGFGVFVQDDALPLNGYGNSVEEAKQNLKDGLTDMIDYFNESGKEIPAAYNNGELKFEYRYDVASIFAYFGVLDATNLAKRIGMNSSLLRQYKTGQAVAGKKAKERIESGLHQLGRELLDIRL